MKKNDLVILTTAFDQDRTFSEDYFASLKAQSVKNFDILIVNDRCSDLASCRKAFPELNVIEVLGGHGIAENRALLINSALDLGYKKAIFADFDDYFSLNRVEVTSGLLDSHDVVVSELKLVSKDKSPLGEQFAAFLQNGQKIALADVLEGNCFGLTNTGLRLEGLPKLPLDPQLKVVDWYLFSLLLARQKTAIYTDLCWTFYRQHDKSMAHIRAVTKEQLRHEMLVKRQHYSLMLSSSSLYEPLLQAVSDFLNDETFLEKYFNLNPTRTSPFWWSLFNVKEYWKIKNETN